MYFFGPGASVVRLNLDADDFVADADADDVETLCHSVPSYYPQSRDYLTMQYYRLACVLTLLYYAND